jgi:hypothetical protein
MSDLLDRPGVDCMRVGAMALIVVVGAAVAQDEAVQRELVRRQQQSDAFELQLRQSQERLQVPAGDLRREREIDARQLAERQRLDNMNARQIRDIGRETPAELRPYEREKLEQERRPLAASQPPVVAAPPEAPAPLPMTEPPPTPAPRPRS